MAQEKKDTKTAKTVAEKVDRVAVPKLGPFDPDVRQALGLDK